MHGIPPSDPGRTIDWGHTSSDYGRWRPGYPASFWRRVEALALDRPGMRVLDLGTGTGNIAREMARRGCTVTGIDVSEGQIAEARRLAESQGLRIEFRVAAAEATGEPGGSADLVTASQCWLYFDAERAVREVLRVLAPGGRLMTCHVSWLPRLDPVARATESLVLRHNPSWSAADWSGEIPAQPKWSEGAFRLAGMFVYDEPLPFTRESWRGRIRACRGVGASLGAAEVEAFDAELDALLGRIAPEEFTVLHRIDAHVLAPLDTPR